MSLNLTDSFNPKKADSRELVAGFARAFSEAASVPALTIAAAPSVDTPGQRL